MTLFSDQDDAPVIDPNKDYYSEFVGDDKKYKDNQAVGRALAEKDAFIERLKAETSGLRTELQTRLKLEEVVDRISSSKSPSSEQTQNAPEPDNSKPADITPDKVKELVAQTINETSLATQKKRNVAFVESKLQEAFGPTYNRTIKDQAQKMGVGEEFLKSLAADQPQAFLKLFDVVPRQETNSTAANAPRSEINTEGLGPRHNDGVKRKSFYENLRRKDPKTYWSVAVQSEEHKEALKQGASFFDV
jgi:hypothetical protein